MNAFVDLARQFSSREVDPRSERISAGEVAALEQLAQAALRAGLTALVQPEEKGGAGLSAADCVPCLETVGVADAGFAVLLAGHLAAGGPADQLWGLALPASGDVVSAGARRRLSGVCRAVIGGSVAEVLVVPTGDGWAAVRRDAPGVAITPWEGALGLYGAGLARVELDSAPSTAGAVTGADALLGAAALGLAADALARGVAYARERYQGGQTIIGHHAVQSLLAEPAAQLVAARLAVLASGRDDSTVCGAAAPLAVRAAVLAADHAVQVHGGYGYMVDYRVERLLRDARTFEAALVRPERALRRWLLAREEGVEVDG